MRVVYEDAWRYTRRVFTVDRELARLPMMLRDRHRRCFTEDSRVTRETFPKSCTNCALKAPGNGTFCRRLGKCINTYTNFGG